MGSTVTDRESSICKNLGGQVRNIKIEGKSRKIYDYYYPKFDDDNNEIIITKRDEKLLFLKLFLDRSMGQSEKIIGENYPFPFYQEYHVEKTLNYTLAPSRTAAELLTEINSPWKVYFHFLGGQYPYDYYLGIETGSDKKQQKNHLRNIEKELAYAISKSKPLAMSMKDFVSNEISQEFIIYSGGSLGVDFDSTRPLDHYVMVTQNRIFVFV